MFKFKEIKVPKGATKNRKRIGRGEASGQGCTAGRGHKGQGSRSGGGAYAGHEGGQRPLYKRMPKNRGFRSLTKLSQVIITTDQLEKLFNSADEVSYDSLRSKLGLSLEETAKILYRGTISKPLKIINIPLSKKAEEVIKSAGGSVS